MGIYYTALHKLRSLRSHIRFRGLKVPVRGAHVSRSVYKHLWRGSYEAPEIDAMVALLRPGDRVLELGAGMAVVTAACAQSQPMAEFRSYEANSIIIAPGQQLLEDNAITNVDLRNAVLISNPSSETVPFHLNTNFTESSLSDRIVSEQTTEVPVEDLDLCLTDYAPTVLLCDIEGAEVELFRTIDLSGFRALVVEIHPALLTRAEELEIYKTCAKAGLFPITKLSKKTVVAFDREGDPFE